MSDELKELDVEFDEAFLFIRKGVEKLDKEKDSVKAQKYQELQMKLQHCRDLLKSYRLEIYDLDKASRVAYEKKAEQYEAEIGRLQSELSFKRPPTDREQLFGDRAGAGVAKDIETMTPEELVAEGKALNKTDLQILQDSNQLLEGETVVIASKTLETLREQTNELEQIGIDLSTIASGTDRAKKTLTTFAKRMAADKIVWLLILLIVGAIVFIIVWSALNPAGALVNITSIAPDVSFGRRLLTPTRLDELL